MVSIGYGWVRWNCWQRRSVKFKLIRDLAHPPSSSAVLKNTLATGRTGLLRVGNIPCTNSYLQILPATFRVTSRGRLQLVQNNYVYHCNRQKDNKIFWKCAEYNRTGCRGRCISIGWSVTVTHALHNHQPVWSESLDESKIISDLSEMKQLFGSPRHVGIDHDHLLSSMYQRTAASQLNEPNPVNLESFWSVFNRFTLLCPYM